VVGGGINGLCCAWALAVDGHQVTLYERERVMQATSSASSKLLHGGIRYLENGQFRLVKEALKERDSWITAVPSLAVPLPILFPKFLKSKRPKWLLGTGFKLYDYLASSSVFPASQWLDVLEVKELSPDLACDNLQGAYLYYDAQMDDYLLGKWVADQCAALGVEIFENVCVKRVGTDGSLLLPDGTSRGFDMLLNVTGPWAEKLLIESAIAPDYHLDLVRGSHIIIDRSCNHALILEVPGEARIFFVIPWKEKILIGTTEERQGLDHPIVSSEKEIEYLVKAYNFYVRKQISRVDVVERFAGLRPLLRSHDNPGKASREYAIQKNNKLITVFGGKWTTARALAEKVKHKCLE